VQHLLTGMAVLAVRDAQSYLEAPVWRAQARDIDTRMEPGELPGPVRERAQPESGREIQCATADRPVSVPCVEDDVTVQQALRRALG
jgi:hypothetical protein